MTGSSGLQVALHTFSSASTLSVPAAWSYSSTKARATHVYSRIHTRTRSWARTFDGPSLIFFIWSLYFFSSKSSLAIFFSTDSPLLSTCKAGPHHSFLCTGKQTYAGDGIGQVRRRCFLLCSTENPVHLRLPDRWLEDGYSITRICYWFTVAWLSCECMMT